MYRRSDEKPREEERGRWELNRGIVQGRPNIRPFLDEKNHNKKKRERERERERERKRERERGREREISIKKNGDGVGEKNLGQ